MKPGRYRRGPGRESEIRRRHIPAAQDARDVAVVVVQRVDEQKKWNRVQADRREHYRNLERGQRQQWGELYRRHEQERRDMSQDWGSLNGRVRQWRAQGKHWDELIPAMRGKAQVRTRWDQVLEWEQRRERAELMREHGRQSRGVEQEADRVYQAAMQGRFRLGPRTRRRLRWRGSGRRRAFPFHSTDMSGTSVLNGSMNSILSGGGTCLTSGSAAAVLGWLRVQRRLGRLNDFQGRSEN